MGPGSLLFIATGITAHAPRGLLRVFVARACCRFSSLKSPVDPPFDGASIDLREKSESESERSERAFPDKMASDTGKVAYVAEDKGYPDEKGVFDSGSPTDDHGDHHGDAARGDVQDFSEKRELK